MTSGIQTPFEWAAQHFQLIGWGTILVVGYKAVRLMGRAETIINQRIKEFDDLHVTITKEILAALTTLVALSQAQGRRWEMWIMGKAAIAERGHRQDESVVMLAEAEKESDFKL